MTDNVKVGQIIDYDVENSADPAEANGTTLAMIVTGVDSDGAYSGTIFRNDGTTRHVVVPAVAPTDAEDAADAEQEALAFMANMTPDQRDALRSKLAGYDVKPDPTPAPTPDPTPAPSPDPTPAPTPTPTDGTGTQNATPGASDSPTSPASPNFGGNSSDTSPTTSTTNGN